MSKILIVGANGTVGSNLVRLLEQEGHDAVRASSRAAQGAGTVRLDLRTGDGVGRAFEGVDKAFLMTPPGYTSQH